MSLDAAILGFLDERPRSGYDLKTRCFDDAVKDFWIADQAQIYRTLERLQTAKLVSAARKRQVGRPDRKVFSITDLGRRTLAEWLGVPLPLPTPRDAFLLQLYFGAPLTDAQIAERLSERRLLHQARLDGLRDHAREAALDADVHPRDGALRDAAFSGAIAVERAAIDWLDDCLEGLKAGHLSAFEDRGDRNPLAGPTTA